MNEPLSNCPRPENCDHSELCPLTQVRAGTAVRIKHLAVAPEVSHRLREMGLGEEQQIRLVSRHASFICQVCNARLGLSAELAAAILVEPLSAPAGAL